MAGAQKISRFFGQGPFPSGATVRPVCVFGLVTASGQLVEAHSLQPSDPNSQAAVEAAKRMNFLTLHHPERDLSSTLYSSSRSLFLHNRKKVEPVH